MTYLSVRRQEIGPSTVCAHTKLKRITPEISSQSRQRSQSRRDSCGRIGSPLSQRNCEGVCCYARISYNTGCLSIVDYFVNLPSVGVMGRAKCMDQHWTGRRICQCSRNCPPEPEDN